MFVYRRVYEYISIIMCGYVYVCVRERGEEGFQVCIRLCVGKYMMVKCMRECEYRSRHA